MLGPMTKQPARSQFSDSTGESWHVFIVQVQFGQSRIDNSHCRRLSWTMSHVRTVVLTYKKVITPMMTTDQDMFSSRCRPVPPRRPPPPMKPVPRRFHHYKNGV